MNRRLFAAGVWVVALMVSAGVARAQDVNWPFERPPRPLPARDVTFPPYEMRTLANGPASGKGV